MKVRQAFSSMPGYVYKTYSESKQKNEEEIKENLGRNFKMLK